MQADILSRYSGTHDDDEGTGGQIAGSGQSGHFEYIQDEDSGALVRKWFEDPKDEESAKRTWTFDCLANPVVDGGIRVAGTTERFTRKGIIETVDYVSLQMPPHVLLTRRDRITNIRVKSTGAPLWIEEELNGTPTIFEVNGVSPITDPFTGKCIEQFVLLQRAEIQVTD